MEYVGLGFIAGWLSSMLVLGFFRRKENKQLLTLVNSLEERVLGKKD